MWKLIDNSSPTNGYLRIEYDGKRVGDVFPFAPDSDEQWVRAKAQLIVDRMNEIEEPLRRAT